jgi:hypothetical protein
MPLHHMPFRRKRESRQQARQAEPLNRMVETGQIRDRSLGRTQTKQLLRTAMSFGDLHHVRD